ncbi:tRNA (adenosine(37)-N6)-threonylcarbamoyltransferase complex ATPase subunit type 1 TsaE [Tropicimonas sp. S265A]|uniref:tRNA (adenosine(37)-N6)-threonylcarbamoyltransferase complex ATPase subunit type 1 TsaE n=1 Tax=Tropicimonas sp. S265A TaxID=3415134 RepID=UPI003C7A788C
MQPHLIGQVQLSSTAQSQALAAAMAPLLRAGDTLLLEGDIGAGKSLICRALIQNRLAAENRMEDVPSPTFTLVQVYALTDLEIWHCDLYRLTTPDEVFELGLDDAFDHAICLIEWPDRLGSTAPPRALTLSLSMVEGQDDARNLVLTSADPSWKDRLAPLLEDILT